MKDYARAASEARLGIASSAGDMLMPYGGDAQSGNQNPYYDFIDLNRSGYLSAEGAYATKLLDVAGTPNSRANAKTDEAGRFAYFYTTNSGYYSLDPNIVDGAFTPDADAPLVTYVETQAILAEALNRTGDQAGSLAALNKIRAENESTFGPGAYAPYVTADFAAGGLLNKVAGQTPATALLKEIITEKYLSLIGQLEPFHDMRRTNNLIGIPKKNPASPNVPQRLLYPQSEINTNPNVPKPIPGLFVKTPVNN